MLLSYARPAGISWFIVGTGAAFLTDQAALTNGRPGSATRIQWLSGAQTTASVLKIQGGWSAYGYNNVQRMAGVIGTTLPVGTKIIASLSTGIGYNVAPTETRVIQRPDGVRVALFVFPDGLPGTFAVQFAIYNDVNGYATIDAGSTFDIGELWVGPAVEWCIRPTYESGREDLSKMQLSIGGQPFPVRRRSMATSQIEISPVTYDQAYGGIDTLVEGVNYVRDQLVGYQPCLIVPITAQPFTRAPINLDYVNRHAEFGYCRSPGPITGDAPRFVFSAEFVAPPPILP